jgi:hypothetical protein
MDVRSRETLRVIEAVIDAGMKIAVRVASNNFKVAKALMRSEFRSFDRFTVSHGISNAIFYDEAGAENFKNRVVLHSGNVWITSIPDSIVIYKFKDCADIGEKEKLGFSISSAFLKAWVYGKDLFLSFRRPPPFLINNDHIFFDTSRVLLYELVEDANTCGQTLLTKKKGKNLFWLEKSLKVEYEAWKAVGIPWRECLLNLSQKEFRPVLSRAFKHGVVDHLATPGDLVDTFVPKGQVSASLINPPSSSPSRPKSPYKTLKKWTDEKKSWSLPKAIPAKTPPLDSKAEESSNEEDFWNEKKPKKSILESPAKRSPEPVRRTRRNKKEISDTDLINRSIEKIIHKDPTKKEIQESF